MGPLNVSCLKYAQGDGVYMSSAMNNWTVKEILREKRSEVTRWRAEGMSRRGCARRLSQSTGRDCTDRVMGRAWDAMDRMPKVPTILISEDESIPTGEIPIEELIDSRVKAARRKKERASRHTRTLELPAMPVGILIFGDNS